MSHSGNDRPQHHQSQASRSLVRMLANNPVYRVFWLGIGVSNVGSWMQMVAQDWLVLVVLDAGPAALGVTVALQLVPTLVASPLGGLLADRLSKRRLLMATNFFGGLCALILGSLVLAGQVEVWHVQVMALLLGAVRALDGPPRLAYASELVAREDVARAVALSSLSFNTARLTGPALAGFLIGFVGTGPVFILNALSYLVPVVALSRIGRRQVAETSGHAPDGRFREGLSYVRARADLVLVVSLMAVVGTFAMNIPMIIALMATEVYGIGPTEFGILGSGMAVGSLIGGLSVARLTPRRITVVSSALVLGGVLVVQGVMPNYVAFALTMPLVGLSSVIVNISAQSYVQVASATHMRGRVISLLSMANAAGRPGSALILGWVAASFGARWVPIGCGLLTVVGIATTTLSVGRRDSLRADPA